MKKINLLSSTILALVLLSNFSCSSDDDSQTTPTANTVSVIQDFNGSINENALSGDVIGTISFTGNGVSNFSLVSEMPSGALSLDAATGEITVGDASIFDFEANTIIEATVSATGVDNNATITIDIDNVNEIGDFNYGGVIFWIDPADDSKGMVCAIQEQTSSIRWDNSSGPTTPSPGTSNDFGTGSANTDVIIAHEGAVEASYAAGIARAYNGDGFNDWFLPSVDEVAEMNSNKAIINSVSTNNGGTVLPDQLWTSSKIDDVNENVYLYNLVLDSENGVLPINSRSVRAVRSFE